MGTTTPNRYSVPQKIAPGAFHELRTDLGGGGGGSSLLYISIAYYMQKGREGVQIACQTVNVINGRPLHSRYSYTSYYVTTLIYMLYNP